MIALNNRQCLQRTRPNDARCAKKQPPNTNVLLAFFPSGLCSTQLKGIARSDASFHSLSSCSVACFKAHKASEHPESTSDGSKDASSVIPAPEESMPKADGERPVSNASRRAKWFLNSFLSQHSGTTEPINLMMEEKRRELIALEDFRPVVPSNDDIDEDFRLGPESLLKLANDRDLRKALASDRHLEDILREIASKDGPETAVNLDAVLAADSEPFENFAQKSLALVESDLPTKTSSR